MKIHYPDKWIFVAENDNYLTYYNKSNIDIDTEIKQIKVWVRCVFTDKGRKDIINFRKSKGLDIGFFYKLGYKMSQYIINYGNMSIDTISRVVYSDSGVIIDNNTFSKIKWKTILSESVSDLLLTKILKEYNIKK